MYLVTRKLIVMQSNTFQKSNLLNTATNAGFRGMASSNLNRKIVVPMLYPSKQNPRKLHICKGFRHSNVTPGGVEPTTQ